MTHRKQRRKRKGKEVVLGAGAYEGGVAQGDEGGGEGLPEDFRFCIMDWGV